MTSTRNIYSNEVDFAELALQSSEFAKCLKPNGQLDFSDPDSVRQLTKSLLLRDFGLKVELPADRLCPPVPNRLNYILWLQDLLDTTGDEYRDAYDPDRDVVGLDIGTGCCSIYPLLGCTTRRRWRFFATDIDDQNVTMARENVARNELTDRITVIKTEATDTLIPTKMVLNDRESLDFTMCNPPFYASRDEMIMSSKAKDRPPFSACTGAEVEMVVDGGEVAFVTRMIDESLRLRERVGWYTSMLGKLSSVSVIIERLIDAGNRNYAVTEFVQGTKTRRWAVAWSWRDFRPAMNVARGITGFPKHLLPFPSEYTFQLSAASLDTVGQRVDAELAALPIRWHWRGNLATGVGFAEKNVWSRQARRKGQTMSQSSQGDENSAALGVKVQLRQQSIDEKSVTVLIRWLKGEDSVLFESFCGMLKRKLEGR